MRELIAVRFLQASTKTKRDKDESANARWNTDEMKSKNSLDDSLLLLWCERLVEALAKVRVVRETDVPQEFRGVGITSLAGSSNCNDDGMVRQQEWARKPSGPGTVHLSVYYLPRKGSSLFLICWTAGSSASGDPACVRAAYMREGST